MKVRQQDANTTTTEGATWDPADLLRLEQQLGRNEAHRRRVLKWLAWSAPPGIAGLAGLVLLGLPSGPLWFWVFFAGMWATLLASAVCIVHIWATWRTNQIIQQGLTEARRYLGVSGR